MRKSGFLVKPSKMFFYVRKHKYLLVKFTAVEEVEDLHHDKGVEDKGEVPRVEVEFILDGLIVNIAVNEVETTWPDCPILDDSLVELVLRMICKDFLVDGAQVFRDP